MASAVKVGTSSLGTSGKHHQEANALLATLHAPHPQLRERPVHTGRTNTRMGGAYSPLGGHVCAEPRIAVKARHWMHVAAPHTPAGPDAVGRNVTTRATGLLATKTQQSNAYGALTAAYGMLALATTFAPGQSLQAALAAPLAPVSTCMMGTVASFLWLMVAAAKCLQGAADHDRLASDTYKRLNLGLLFQSIALGVLQLRHKALLGDVVLGASAALLVPTAFVAARVYAVSNGGACDALQVVKGFAAGVRDCFSPKNLTSFYYAFSALCSVAGFIVLFPADNMPLFAGGPVTALGAYLIKAVGASLLVNGVVNYVQKDAADRGRLGASTFKKLNLALAVSLVGQAWFIYMLGPQGVAVDANMQMGVVGQALLGAVVCTWQYFMAKK